MFPELAQRRCRASLLLSICCAGLLLPGCARKSNQVFQAGKKGQTIQNYDAALNDYEEALKKDPQNAQYKLKMYEMRFEASQFHVKEGVACLAKQEHQLALQEFQTALQIDPSNALAKQEIEYTERIITSLPLSQKKESTQTPEQEKAQSALTPALNGQPDAGFMQEPPSLLPLSNQPVTLQLNADSRTAFKTLAQLAGVNVIFDPEFQERKINMDLVNVTVRQALNVASLESKSFWKPITSNIILVMPDTAQKRKEEEEQILRKIYLEHRQSPQELSEMATTLQQMLELRHVQALPHDNAILIRDTPAKILLASRLIHDSDRSKPEVVVQISILQVRRDKARSLGIQPGSTTTLQFTPTPGHGRDGKVPLDVLHDLSAGDFSLTIPNVVAAALFTDSATKIIQNPEVRVSDGESARLRIGDRIPIATGSFQATGVSPVVNTQFQYIDVGVNIDLTPRVHPDRSVSMKLAVEVSSLNGQVDIGGILQPVISQRRVEHEIRLNEGEVSILGGLAERSQSKSVSGWPLLSRLPLLRYLFSGEDVNNSENEVLIVITPRLVRMRDVAGESFNSLSVGTDSELVLREKEDVLLPTSSDPAKRVVSAAEAPAALDQEAQQPTLQLEPQRTTIAAGHTSLIQVKLENVSDLFSVSLLFKYDPQILAIEDVRHGNFLSGGTQEVAIVQRINKERGEGQIFTTRQPNTAGVDGKGFLVGLLVRHLTDAPAALQVVQVAARNSRQKSTPIAITQGTTEIK